MCHAPTGEPREEGRQHGDTSLMLLVAIVSTYKILYFVLFLFCCTPNTKKIVCCVIFFAVNVNTKKSHVMYFCAGKREYKNPPQCNFCCGKHE